MVNALLWIIGIIAGGIIGVIVLCKLISFIWAVLSDLGGLVWSFLLVGGVICLICLC